MFSFGFKIEPDRSRGVRIVEADVGSSGDITVLRYVLINNSIRYVLLYILRSRKRLPKTVFLIFFGGGCTEDGSRLRKQLCLP